MTISAIGRIRSHAHALGVIGTVVGLGVFAPSAMSAEPVPASLSDVRVTEDAVAATLVLRGAESLVVDPASLVATLGGEEADVTSKPAAEQPRSTMLVIDTSGSMGASGMSTARAAVREFLETVPAEVKVGLVSFADTSGVDVEPTTDHARVSRAVSALRSDDGETALYSAIQDAVAGLGTVGERSIILLSDGGDTVADDEGGKAAEASQRRAALQSVTKAKVRAEVVAFKSPESNNDVLKALANAGGGSVVSADDRAAVAESFAAAARALESQLLLDITRPAGVSGTQELVVTGAADGRPFKAFSAVDLGDTAPLAEPSETATSTAAPVPAGPASSSSGARAFLIIALVILTLGLFLIAAVLMAPVFRSRRQERLSAIEQYGLGVPRSMHHEAPSSGIGEQLVTMGDRVMSGRESTTKTMALIDRADLPWRAGEWFVLRILAVLILGGLGFLLFRSHPTVGTILGLVLGLVLPPVLLRYLAKRRTRKFESALPDVLMLVATSLSSGFSLLQALDSVAKDAPEPAAKEFSRALAEARIGSDVSDALDHMSVRMESENMRWTTMAIRIQREVGGNLAETLKITAATLREREMLRRQVRALSAEGRLSAYILLGLPVLMLVYSSFVNYDYVSLLWTTTVGILMCIAGILAMIVGVFWMRKIVAIEV